MTFKQMESFCALAETMSFSKAAEKIFLSQSTLSREISSLEKELGCQLLERSRKSPRLTLLGERILPQAREILSAQKEIQKAASLARNGSLGELKIGFIPHGLTEPILEKLRKFQCQFPGVGVELSEYVESELYQAVETEKIDFGIVVHIRDAYRNVFHFKKVDISRQCVIVNEQHRLAGEESVRFSQLMQEKFVIVSPGKVDEGYAFLMDSGLENNFVPDIVAEVDSYYSMLVNVSCNLGISVAPETLKSQSMSHVCFIPISDGRELEYYIIWKRGIPVSLNKQFIESLDR